MDRYLQGIWAVELALDCPKTTNFTLLDCNSHICQATYPSLPENVQLRQFNLLDDFVHHLEWTDHFDIVHQRLMLVAWAVDQWQIALKNYFSVLKPGGYLQLWESDLSSKEKWCLGPWARLGVRHVFELAAKRGMKPDIVPDLPGFLQAAGFEVISQNFCPLDFSFKPSQPEPFPNTMPY
jgi:ubiquinone/menaquinone biosynthesis C-methylase UbiE